MQGREEDTGSFCKSDSLCTLQFHLADWANFCKAVFMQVLVKFRSFTNDSFSLDKELAEKLPRKAFIEGKSSLL